MAPQQQQQQLPVPDDSAGILQEPLLLMNNGGDGGDHAASSPLPGDSPVEQLLSSSSSNNDQNNNNKDIVLGSILRMNHNVFLNLVLAVLYGISNSLWNGTAYAAYLKKLGGNTNGPLGNIEAASGAASLITALPIGYLADKIGRSKVIRAGGIMLLVITVLQIAVMEWVGTDEVDNDNDGGSGNDTTYSVEGEYENDDEDAYWLGVDSMSMTTTTSHEQPFSAFWHRSASKILSHLGSNVRTSHEHTTTVALWIMGVIMVFWGLADGIVGGPCQALFADSTPEGQRTHYYNILFICYTGASACGPLVSILLFQTLGDTWDLYHLRIVIYVGLGLEIFNSILMMLFDDSKALDEEEGNDDQQDNGEAQSQPNSRCSETEAEAPEIDGIIDSNDENGRGGGADTGDDAEALTPLQKRQKWIPYVVFLQGLIFAIGSGMTVKFFPLFFKDEVGMTPSQVQIIYTIVPAVMVIASTACTKLAGAGFGRVQTMLLFSCLGVSLLYSMVFFKSYLDRHPFLLVPIYVMRTALMNATYPIQESVLMDFVPKNERARWKSLDSVASFGWCGSAALGGWLADKYDYTYTFLITAILQSMGIVVWTFLIPLVPRKEGSHVMDDNENITDAAGALAAAETETAPAGNTLTQPLLADEDQS